MNPNFVEWVTQFREKNGRLPKGYVAGPMTLYKDLDKTNPMRWGRYAFEETARAIRSMFPGIDIFVPIEEDDKEGGPDVVFGKYTWEQVLGKDLTILAPRDFIVFLPAYNDSKGAVLEGNYGQGEGKSTFRAILYRPGVDTEDDKSMFPGEVLFSDRLNPKLIVLHQPDEPCYGTYHARRWSWAPRSGGKFRLNFDPKIEFATGPIGSGGASSTPGGFKPTNPKDRAATSRLDLSLFPQTAICYGALAMAEGDMKYGGYNYRPGGVLASVYVAALLRHIFKWYNGQEDDPKTQVPHLANAMACLGVIIDAIECGSLKDDRPPVVDVDGLLSRFEGKVKYLQGIMPCDKPRYTQKEHPMPPKKPA